MSVYGWFADTTGEGAGDFQWQPCFSPCSDGVIHSFDVWFRTREECEDYIRDEILPVATDVDFRGPLLPPPMTKDMLEELRARE